MPHTAKCIACLQPSATVILGLIGELGRVVACTRFCAGWGRTAAAPCGRVFGIRDEFLNTPGAHAASGVAGASLCDSSQTFRLHERNPADYWRFRFHSWKFDRVS
jgi:hypothetical protein